jgi:DNA-binding GntR family transcriptional regulator
LKQSIILSYNKDCWSRSAERKTFTLSTPLSENGLTTFAISHIAAPIREQVEQRLRQAITGGHFRPGDRLIERELCALLGVSRSSLREALRQLEGEGLVVNIPHKGMVVATMTREQVKEIYQVRAVVEGLAGRLCADQMTEALETALRAAMKQVEAAYESGDLAALVAAKDQFYQVLLDGCGNRTAGVVLQSLHDRIASLRVLTLTQPGRAVQSVAEMQRILEAILMQDPQAACRACSDHVEQAAAVAVQALEQQSLEACDLEPRQEESSTTRKEHAPR